MSPKKELYVSYWGSCDRYIIMSFRPPNGSKGQEAHFQDFDYVLVFKGVGPSEELLVQKEKKYSLGTFRAPTYHTKP